MGTQISICKSGVKKIREKIIRNDIQRLRAFAVVVVVLYHANINAVKNGFLGVDIFFVISGYLIIGSIVREIDEGNFSLKSFYMKRIRRIFPPIISTVIISIPIAWITLLPSELKDFFQSVIGSLTFTSNFLFMREAGYFEPASELKPLVHTWSLAIEEQFYLLIPLFLLLLASRFTRHRFRSLSIISFLSCLLWVIAPVINVENFYYGLQFRFWELGLGGLFAISKRPSLLTSIKKFPVNRNRPFYWVSLILLCSNQLEIPSVYRTILVCLLTAILLTASPKNPDHKAMFLDVPVYIGTLSYSIYLVHQPILAFLRLRSIELHPFWIFFIIYVFALFIFLLVERPIWKQKKIADKNLLIFISILMCPILILSFFGHQSGGFPDRIAKDIRPAVFPEKTHTEICDSKPKVQVGRVQICLFGDMFSSNGVLVYGDSHAWHLMGELDRHFKTKGIRGYRVIIREECSIFPEISQVSQTPTTDFINGCKKDFRDVLKFISQKNLQTIFASRWTIQIHPIPGLLLQRGFNNGVGGIETERNEVQVYVGDKDRMYLGLKEKKLGINYVLESLQQVSRNFIVIYPVPEVGWQLARKNFISGSNFPKYTSYPSEAYFKRNNVIIQILDKFIENHSTVSKVVPSEIFCDSWLPNQCVVQIGPKPLYYDYNHLSNFGASFVVTEIAQKIG